MITRLKVTSSTIKEMAFDSAKSILYVQFHAGLYEYQNVPVNLFDLFQSIQATKGQPNEVSIGSTFAYTIKNSPTLYPYRRVSPNPGVSVPTPTVSEVPHKDPEDQTTAERFLEEKFGTS